MRKVIFEGELGEKFGKETYIEASSFQDVIKCFMANFDDFKQYLLDSEKRQIGFICKINNVAVGEHELTLRYGKGDMVITPVPIGGIGKFIKSAFKILVGIVLVVVGVMSGQWGLALQGLSMVFSGVAELLAPDPGEDEGPQEDYLYSGTAQIIGENDPIPICYGRMRIPAKPISFDIRASNATISQNSTNSDHLYGAKGGTTRQASTTKFTAAIAAATELTL